MTTPLVIPNAAVGDAVLVDRNAMGSLISAAYNSIPGDNINASSIPTSALQKPKAKFPFRVIIHYGNSHTQFSSYTTNKQVLPYVDGASSSTWTFLHAVAVAREVITATGTMDVYKNGASMFGGSPPFNFASMSNNTPVVAAPAAPVSFTSWNGTNDYFTCVFSALSGTIHDLDVTLWFSLNHAGT